MPVRVKVCGMRERYNIEALSQLPVDFVGLIFYPKSSRYVFADTHEYADSTAVDLGFLRLPFEGKGNYPKNLKKVGVFVNEELDQVLNYVHNFELDYVQLHGQENVFYCKQLKDAGVKIIKAFSVDRQFSFTITNAFEFYCDFFLFDTKGKLPGGNGVAFDWKTLENYHGETPFFLSGGLAPGMEDAVINFKHEQFFALDINSGFENYPGFKNVDLISDFLNKINKALSEQNPDW